MAGIAELKAKLQEKSGYGKNLFEGCSGLEEMVKRAGAAGFSVTGDELVAAIAETRAPRVLELDDSDLEQIAGGVKSDGWCTCYGA